MLDRCFAESGAHLARRVLLIRLTQRPERSSELRREELRLFPGGEVSALVDFVKINQVAIGTAGPSLPRAIDVLPKYPDCHRQPDLPGLLRASANNAGSRGLLPAQ